MILPAGKTSTPQVSWDKRNIWTSRLGLAEHAHVAWLSPNPSWSGYLFAFDPLDLSLIFLISDTKWHKGLISKNVTVQYQATLRRVETSPHTTTFTQLHASQRGVAFHPHHVIFGWKNKQTLQTQKKRFKNGYIYISQAYEHLKKKTNQTPKPLQKTSSKAWRSTASAIPHQAGHRLNARWKRKANVPSLPAAELWDITMSHINTL